MSDIEKAIKHFTKRNFWLKANPVCQRVQKRVDKQNYEIQRNDLAISALEKQIPKKPIKKRFVISPDAEPLDCCPSCGNYLSNRHYKCCNDCGQKLDWSVEE